MEDGNAPGEGALDGNGGVCETAGGPVGLAGIMFGGNVVWTGAPGGAGPLGNTPGGGGPGLLPAKGGGCWLKGEELKGLGALPPKLLDAY